MTSEGKTSENGVALRPYKDIAVGRPAGPDLSSMTQEDREAYRETVGRLQERVEKAEKGSKEAVP